MLELRNVTLRLKSDGRPILENFSFSLCQGDRAVLIGEEGNGKSTLLKFIADRLSVEDYCETDGQALCDGTVGYLPQWMDESLRETTLAAYFDGAAWYERPELLQRLGWEPERLFSEQTLGTLSGGERVKAQLCRLLLAGPDVLLLDEPANDLDIETLEWLEGFLLAERRPVLYISHDETLIERTANVIVHMEKLRNKTESRVTVSRERYRDYLARRGRTFANQARVAEKQREEYQKQMDRWRQIHSRVEHEQRAISRGDPSGGRLLKKKMHAVQSMGRRFERQREEFLDIPREEQAILTTFDAAIRLPAGKTVLELAVPELRIGERVLSRDVRLLVRGPETVGITGKNGAGKTTLLAQIWALLRERRDITAAYMPQDYRQALPPDKSPVEYLVEHYDKERVTLARTRLGSMRFTHGEMTGPIAALSGGQRAKLLFLDMVLRGADVLLLDEPTRNFSPLSAPVVRAALRDFGGAIISVSHDRKYLAEVCDAVYELTETGLREQRAEW